MKLSDILSFLKESSNYINTSLLALSYSTTTFFYEKRASKLKANNLIKEYSQLEKIKLLNNSICLVTAMNHVIGFLKEGAESKSDYLHGIALMVNAIIAKDSFYKIIDYVTESYNDAEVIRVMDGEIPIAEVIGAAAIAEETKVESFEIQE